ARLYEVVGEGTVAPPDPASLPAPAVDDASGRVEEIGHPRPRERSGSEKTPSRDSFDKPGGEDA
ncbi:MAG TPA: hypothetical protein VF249_10645, partial [Arthrobacter sp.]